MTENQNRGVLFGRRSTYWFIMAAFFIFNIALGGFGLVAPALADTVTLNPSASGGATNLSRQGGTANWNAAMTSDFDTSYVYSSQVNNNYLTDRYNLPNLSSTGTINSVTVYMEAKTGGAIATQPSARTVVRMGGTNYFGIAEILGTTYATYSTTYLTDPSGGSWTWTDINNLRAGVSLRRAQNFAGGSIVLSRATHVWVVVDFTPPDTTPPVISGTPADMIVEADSPIGATVTYTAPTAADNIDGSVVVSCVPPSGSVFPFGLTTVTCTASDSAGNSASTNFNVTVQDTTGPTIDAHADVIAEATGPTGAIVTYTAPNATDIVDGTFSATCVPASGSTFPIGFTIVTCSASDTRGNSAVPTTFNVQVQDTTAPVITLNGLNPLNLVIGDTYAEDGATAIDVVDGSVTVTVGGDTVVTSLPGLYNVTYDAVDAAGNSATQVIRNVTVSDVSAPVINPIVDISVEATSASGADVSFGAVTATDDVDGVITAVCTPTSGSTFVLGTTAVICNATDSSGNIGFGTGLNITVTDLTAPTVTISPATQIVEATSGSGAAASYTVSAIDIVDGDISSLATCDYASGATFPLGNTTVTCSVTDARVNTGSGTATITVQDTTAPVINAHAEVVAEATGPTGAIVTYTAPNAVDAVDGTFSATCVPASDSVFPLGNTAVICDASDVRGNAAVQTSFNVKVQDTTAPIITLNGLDAVNLTLGWLYVEQGASAGDIVDGVIPVTVGGAVNSDVLGAHYITYNAIDAAGNIATQLTRAVNVVVATGGGGSAPPAPPELSSAPVTSGGGSSGGASPVATLNFDARNAAWVAIAETSDFTGTSWLPYSAQRTFVLSGNSVNKLYVKFRRGDTGGESKVIEVAVAPGLVIPPIQAVLGVKVTRLDELVAKLKRGSRGAEVTELQAALKKIGLFPKYQRLTKYYGPVTSAGVKKYLAKQKLVKK